MTPVCLVDRDADIGAAEHKSVPDSQRRSVSSMQEQMVNIMQAQMRLWSQNQAANADRLPKDMSSLPTINEDMKSDRVCTVPAVTTYHCEVTRCVCAPSHVVVLYASSCV